VAGSGVRAHLYIYIYIYVGLGDRIVLVHPNTILERNTNTPLKRAGQHTGLGDRVVLVHPNTILERNTNTPLKRAGHHTGLGDRVVLVRGKRLDSVGERLCVGAFQRLVPAFCTHQLGIRVFYLRGNRPRG
jgi:hypothetical protein